MYYIRKGKLNDRAVVSDMKKAILLYEDGAILEAKDLLANIVGAIEEFEEIQGAEK